jgi:Gas vesicle protein
MAIQHAAQHSIASTNIADLLERILDKGVVIAGDIKISLVDVELLTIQLRLVICSVDKAKEMGMDWWVNNPCFSRVAGNEQVADSLSRIEERLERLEAPVMKESGSHPAPGN